MEIISGEKRTQSMSLQTKDVDYIRNASLNKDYYNITLVPLTVWKLGITIKFMFVVRRKRTLKSNVEQKLV